MSDDMSHANLRSIPFLVPKPRLGTPSAKLRFAILRRHTTRTILPSTGEGGITKERHAKSHKRARRPACPVRGDFLHSLAKQPRFACLVAKHRCFAQGLVGRPSRTYQDAANNG